MLIAQSCPDDTFMGTLFLANQAGEGEWSLESLTDAERAGAFLKHHFPEFQQDGVTCAERIAESPACPINKALADRWTSRDGTAVLIGDAAHAMAPFLGQGMNCAMEDCLLFAHLAQDHAFDLPRAAAAYEEQRKPDAAAICRMSDTNYLEIRKTAVEDKFLRRREVESALQKQLPGKFLPRYAMIAFTGMPYAEVEARVQMQDSLIEAFLRGDPQASDVGVLVEDVDRHLAALDPGLMMETDGLPCNEPPASQGHEATDLVMA